MKIPSRLRLPFAFAALLLAALPPAATAQVAPPSSNPLADASAPMAKRDKGEFVKRHESFLARARSGPIGLLFLGDSITDNWSHAPAIFTKYYGAYQPANFGIGGDITQNVIWRIDHGELDGIHPRVVVLMIGTNNSGSNSAEDIAAAVKKIIGMIQAKIPETKVLLLAIFPRGPRHNRDGSADNYVKRMAVITATNPLLAALDNGTTIRYLDLGPKFLGPDGQIPDAIMGDHLHPTVAGYQIWADAMQPLLQQMLQ
jgi:lysophospholipase L1-like esterase